MDKDQVSKIYVSHSLENAANLQQEVELLASADRLSIRHAMG